MAKPLPERIKQYKAWLNRENTRPLTGLLWEPDIPPLPEFLSTLGEKEPVNPDTIDPEMYLPHIEKWAKMESRLNHDIIHCFCPAFGFPWVEAIAGCEVLGSPGSLWAEPFLESYSDRVPFRFDPENPWVKKLLAFTEALVSFSNGRFPVAMPQMRGPLDTLAALRGADKMCMDLIEQPGRVHQVLKELTGLWIDIASALLEVIPPFHGGFTSRMKMWAPGPTITPQNDISTLISPDMYCEFCLPLDRKIMDTFEYHLFHLHATEYLHFRGLSKIERLSAFQITLEHTLGGPPLETLLPLVREIMEVKPVLVCALDFESANRCINDLPAQGLAVTVGIQEYELDQAYDDWAGKWGG